MSPLFKKRVVLAIRVSVLVALIGGMNFAAERYGLTEYLDPERLRGEVDTLGAKAFLLYFGAWVLLHVPAGQAFLPGAAGAVMFGWAAGGVMTVLGLGLAATLQFLVVRYLLRDAAAAMLERRFPTLGRSLEERGLGLLVLTRFLWVPPPWMVNVGAALTPISLKTYLAAFPACLPGALITCLAVDSVFTYGWWNIPAERWGIFLGVLGVSVVGYQMAKRRWPELGEALRRP